MTMRIGIDLGGTKIELVALAPDGEELIRSRVPTPQGDYLGTVDAVAGLIDAAERKLGQRGTIGIGSPGAQSLVTGLMKNANSICLNDKPLKSDLEAALQREVRLANDANCFALAEATDGAGAGADVVFGVILGTGVGGGVVVHGRILQGSNSICGEWGHNQLPNIQASDTPLPLCYCGRNGCNETYLSGPGLREDHLKVTHTDLPVEEIARRADARDRACAATLNRYLDRLARALAVVINILDPDVIVIGGGLSNMKAIYRELPRRWTPYVFSDSVRTRVLPNRLGDSAGVRGAAWLWNAD